MRIAQITLNDSVYESLAEITFHKNKVEYCKRHGYEAIQKNSGFVHEIIGFEKIQFIYDLLNDRSDLDWVHWTGTDTLITNFNQKLEDIIDNTYHMVVCFDGNGMNVDSFLLKNSRIGRALMKWVLDNITEYANHYWYEQQALIDFYFKAPLGKDIIKALPQRVMNSYIYDLYPEWRNRPHVDHTGNDGDWKEGDFMLHLPGTSLQQRIEIMTQFLSKVVK